MSEIIDSNGTTTDSTASSSTTIHDSYDVKGDDALDYAVVVAAAAARGADPLDLPPLYDSVDVDALDAIIDGARDRPDDVDGQVTFTYAGFEVTVAFDGQLRLDPLDDDSIA